MRLKRASMSRRAMASRASRQDRGWYSADRPCRFPRPGRDWRAYSPRRRPPWSACRVPRRARQRDRRLWRRGRAVPGPSALPCRGRCGRSDNDALVGCLAPAVSGAIVDDEGLGAAGLYADAKSSEPVVPRDPGFVVGFEGLDGSLGQRQLNLCDSFFGVLFHAPIVASGAPQSTQ